MLWRSSAPKRQPLGFLEPCIPTRADTPPVGSDWIHEIKHDGYRLIVRKKDGRVRLFTRRGYDWTDRFPLIREAVAALRPSAMVLDGEAVFCDPNGTANFEKLHSQAHNDRVFLYAFDLLELGGIDLRVETGAPGSAPAPPQKGQRAHRRGRSDDLRTRLQAGVRGHRLEAPGAPLSVWAEQVVAEDQEPVGARHVAV